MSISPGNTGTVVCHSGSLFTLPKDLHFCRCVAPDLRGYGDTEKPSGVEEYSIENLAGDVNNLVKGK